MPEEEAGVLTNFRKDRSMLRRTFCSAIPTRLGAMRSSTLARKLETMGAGA